MPERTIFSPCRRYRYTLWRSWGGLFGASRYAMFVGLNPSTADETMDDPTIRRCVSFAKKWGYDALCMTNLFAFRATDPNVLKRQREPVGRGNNKYLVQCARTAGIVVAAWGAHGAFRGRDAQVLKLLADMHYLRLTKGGHPAHPLYLPADLEPMPFKHTRREE